MYTDTLPGPADLALTRSEGAAKRSASALQAAAAKGDRTAVRKAAEEFEGQFLSQMLGHMFKDLKTDGMFGGGQAESMWRDVYVEQLGKAVSNSGGIGVADVIERQLLQLQEVNNGSA